MKRGYLKRITELEQLQSSQPSTAATYRDVFTNAGIDVPEPLPDEDAEEYINRLPGEAKVKLLAFYGVVL